MPEVKLPNGTWWYDEKESLGPPGGFGAVFRGRSTDGEPVAIKRLESEYQAREMRIADFLLGHGLAHVIPIVDAGFDKAANTNFIVMPIATTSLRQLIEISGPVGEADTVNILDSIAAGLDEIGDIIHRDLKPGNVLLHDGIWKLADLGLARFAEAATSGNTMRGALTAQYAAPEQWRGERPTKATDVYALGCIMYALLHGTPPFQGPGRADFSHQHQFVAPSGLNASSHLKRLAAACLSKSPALRPSIQSLRKQLQIASNAGKGGRTYGMASAAAAVLEKTSREEERRLQRENEERNRKQLAAEAVQLMEEIFRELETIVLNEAPNTEVGLGFYNAKLKRLKLGDAVLEYGTLFPSIEDTAYPHQTGNRAGSRAWDVLAGAYIAAHTGWSPDVGRSANLWFGRLLEGDDYRWWEVSYVYREDSTLEEYLREPEPFGIKEIYDGPILHLVSDDPRPITPEYVDDFLGRWIEPFSQIAAVGHMAAKALFPARVRRQPVAAKFKLDRP